MIILLYFIGALYIYKLLFIDPEYFSTIVINDKYI